MRRLSVFSMWMVALLFVGPLLAPASAASDDWTNALAPIAAAEWNYQRAAHLLERAGFGGTPAEIEKLAKLSPTDAVNALLDYENVDVAKLPSFEPSGIYPNGHKFRGLEAVVPKALVTGKAFGIKAIQEGALPYQPAINEFYTLLWSEHMEMQRASLWWAERMLLTPRPMEEKLTLFWHDHFATSQSKLMNYELMMAQIETLRRHANGNFRKMLVAVAQDPAMLIWLDNRENVKGKPNENFAREVMELFTMGEGHGYSETDIREMARAFTGWTMKPIETVEDKAEFIDDPKLHDDGEKTFLGKTGKFNGYDAIHMILEQPAASKFISGKLYKYFVREQLDPSINDQLAKQLVESNYDLKPVLKTILLSKDFYSPASVGTQIKSPVHFLVSTCRKLGLQQLPGIPDYVETTGSQLGQLLFYPPNVAGWPGDKSWINPATLLSRGNYVYAMLFPDPESYPAPDKVGPEGYRKIPLMFPEYNIPGYVWNEKSQKMETVSLVQYDRHLAGIGAGMMSKEKKQDAKMAEAPKMMKPDTSQGKSRMTQIAHGERYNLAVGVYTGYVQAYDRVKPRPRSTAQINFVAMTDEGQVQTVEAAVDYLSRRFLSVPLAPERRAAIVGFLKGELGGEKIDFTNKATEEALRRAAHLILSAPEYQLG
jgi:hypothetical protein